MDAWPDILKESLETYHQVLGDFIRGDTLRQVEASRRAEEPIARIGGH